MLDSLCFEPQAVDGIAYQNAGRHRIPPISQGAGSWDSQVLRSGEATIEGRARRPRLLAGRAGSARRPPITPAGRIAWRHLVEVWGRPGRRRGQGSIWPHLRAGPSDYPDLRRSHGGKKMNRSGVPLVPLPEHTDPRAPQVDGTVAPWWRKCHQWPLWIPSEALGQAVGAHPIIQVWLKPRLGVQRDGWWQP